MINKDQTYFSIGIREITDGRNIYFDPKAMRRAMTLSGKLVQKDARTRVNRKARSQKGEYPGRMTGRLSRSIKYKVSRPGFLVVIRPEKDAGFGNGEFYPAFLHYGVRNFRKQNHRKHATSTPFRIEPRENYMADALQSNMGVLRGVLLGGFSDGLMIR